MIFDRDPDLKRGVLSLIGVFACIGAMYVLAGWMSTTAATPKAAAVISWMEMAAVPIAQQQNFAHQDPSQVPELIYTGATSSFTSLGASEWVNGNTSFRVEKRLLGHTARGRWFLVDLTWSSNNGSIIDPAPDCYVSERAKCVAFQMNPLTAEEAQSFFRRSHAFTPEGFKSLFGADAPPLTVPA